MQGVLSQGSSASTSATVECAKSCCAETAGTVGSKQCAAVETSKLHKMALKRAEGALLASSYRH